MDSDEFQPTFEGEDWARAFVAAVRRYPDMATDESRMAVWFDQALWYGYDEAERDRAIERLWGDR